jgi:signal transduction histidine kinase
MYKGTITADDKMHNAELYYYKIAIQDNGVGFDNDYKDKIFQIFQQASSTKGKGMGLAVCRRIMANHSGFIDASGEPGKGAVINLYFPVTH